MFTVADAFTGTGALAPAGRGALALLLGGRRGAIEEAPLGDVVDRGHRRRLRDTLVDAAADDNVLDRLAATTFAQLAPGAALLPDGRIGAHHGPTRLVNLLARRQADRWSTLLGLRVGDIRTWTRAHPRTTAEIVGVAFERSLVGLAAVHHDAAPPGAAVDLAVLLDHEQGAPNRLLLDALTALAGDGQPEEVRRAATRLLRAVPNAGSHHPQVLADILAAAGDSRDVEVFAERALRLRQRPTNDDVAERMGLSPERIRQLRLRAEGRARAAAAEAPADTLALVGAVRGWLGAVVPVDVADGVARRLGTGSAHTRIGGLLLWLAGPYQPVPARQGWLALDPADAVTRTTEALAADGGVRPTPEIRAELAAQDVRPEHHEAWLAACGGVGVDDMVVHAAGGLATMAERTLFASGRRMSPVEIATLAAGPDRADEVRGVLRRDRRFVRMDADGYELAEWGGVAAPAPPDRGGATTPTPIDGRWWLPVRVDAAVLRGATIPAPEGLAPLLAVLPRRRPTFVSRYGPVTIVEDGPAAGLGSLRHIALACGAEPGDDIWLGFDPAGDVSVRRRAGHQPQHDPAGWPLPDLPPPAPCPLAAQGV